MKQIHLILLVIFITLIVWFVGLGIGGSYLAATLRPSEAGGEPIWWTDPLFFGLWSYFMLVITVLILFRISDSE